MGAIVNGMVLSKLRAYGSTFLIFSDYMKMPIRLSAIMEIPVDLDLHPRFDRRRRRRTDAPADRATDNAARGSRADDAAARRDANEVVEAWKVIMKLQKEPVALILTRQALPTFDRTKYASAAGVARGAYILADAEGGKPQVILMATGSEVYLCIDAYEKLKAEGIRARVVSMPSWDIVRASGPELPRSGTSARRNRAGRGRDGFDLRLGAVRRTEGAHHRHAHLWGVRSAQGFAEEVRLHVRRRACRQRANCSASNSLEHGK